MLCIAGIVSHSTCDRCTTALQVGTQIIDEDLNVVRELEHDPELEGKDPDHVAMLCKETIQNGHSVLIFCCSKAVSDCIQ